MKKSKGQKVGKGKRKKVENKKAEEKKSKWKPSRKIIAVFGILAVFIVCFFIINKFHNIQINGDMQGPGTANGKGGAAQVENTPAPTCSDSIQNQGEGGVDCNGPCSTVCPPTCSDGILNQDETKIDCGGTICPACPTCTDKILNQGERLVDCGGPCNACPPDCTDGIKNQDETAIDCGGKICGACPTCFDKIQNQGELGIDCSGPCIACPASCTDGIQNQGETGVDCGSPCSACVAVPVRPVITDAQRTLISQTITGSQMIKDLPSNAVIALRFYDFYLGERIWQPDILIGKTGVITSGTPDMVLIMHARYINQLNGANLCEVTTSAKTNGEMWMESSLSTTKLLLKYSGMMKYKSCFGM
jgi:hypothetical protein